MAEKIKPELLGFLQAGDLPLRILVVESLYYLPALRQMMPQAEILAVAAESDAMDGYEGLDVKFSCVDYLSERLPFAPEYFDYIISYLTLEQAGNPQDIAAGFSTYLKQTGSFLTSRSDTVKMQNLQYVFPSAARASSSAEILSIITVTAQVHSCADMTRTAFNPTYTR